ncbi:hypothetical protein KCU92_g129, partial [Aureobasidium melanogenum]
MQSTLRIRVASKENSPFSPIMSDTDVSISKTIIASIFSPSRLAYRSCTAVNRTSGGADLCVYKGVTISKR